MLSLLISFARTLALFDLPYLTIPSGRFTFDIGVIELFPTVTQKSRETKDKLLQAAAQIVQEQGVTQLTLEAVAKQASVSKGGLLYHYPSKTALLEAMVSRLIETFEAAMLNQLESNSTSWLEAYIKLSFNPESSQVSESMGILAAVANDPSLLAPLRKRYQDWQVASESSGLDPALATIMRLAADGLWFTELFDVSPLSAEMRSQVLATLLQLIKEKSTS